jgi:aryl-alcohol dehydrogenase-like predicted oxidoreductase
MTVEEAKGSARVRLGHSELTVRPVGLGCMGMSQFYGAADDSESVDTIRSAIDLGVDFLDTSDVYGAALIATATNVRGFGHNEQLIGAAIHDLRDKVVLATKFGVKVNDARNGIVLDGRPEYVAAACEASLRRLGTDVIDLYYCHRLDPSVPIEDTVGAMAELVTAGKVRALGLSEVGPRPDPPGTRRAPRHCATERVLTVGAARRGRNHRNMPRTRHHVGAVQPIGPIGADRRVETR